jgi:hypothetical protein
MNAHAPLQADAEVIGRFADALFRYADPDTFASLRSFRDDRTERFEIIAHRIGEDLSSLKLAAVRLASKAANAPFPVVFAPPVATFLTDNGAKETDLANGLALSVECDAAPAAARERLEAILGPATVVVASGGEWPNPATGELEPKLHLHWRLTEPTRDAADHARLKRARALATRLVGGDGSNTPAVHPIRWPGSWHRKTLPKIARIAALGETHEVDLADALGRLSEAASAAGLSDAASKREGAQAGRGEARESAELIRAVLTGEDYHTPLAALAMRFLKAGMEDGAAVNALRGLMLAVPDAERDMKDGVAASGRWALRFADIPRAVSTARAKLGERRRTDAEGEPNAWPDPMDFLGDADLTGAPVLRPEHLPDALAGFVFDTAARMGTDPATVAMVATVTCSAVVNEAWQLQPKVHDDTWTERARLWGAVIGDPSILKTPVIAAATRPVDKLDADARAAHADAMRRYKAQVAQLKADKVPPEGWPPQPLLDRYLVEGATIEGLTEVLRGEDDGAKQRAPAGKVLVRQDELSGWIADMDRYKSGGKGGGDRAHYLRLFNGGRYVVDRIGRGSFASPSWSGCVLGGIQPEPIRRIAAEAADDGLLQRFLYAVPGPQGEGEDRRPNTAALARYEALFPALAALKPAERSGFAGQAPRPVVLHRDAHGHREAINRLVQAHSALPDASPRLKAALGKWPGIFARLALTFHIIAIADANARGEMPPAVEVLSEETARRAGSYLRDVLLPHLLRAEGLLFQSRQTGHARWIAGHILASERARTELRVTARDLQRAYGPLRAPESRRELGDVMQALEVFGWVRAEPPDNPARQVHAWFVNPTLHATFADRAAEERDRRRRAQEAFSEAGRSARHAA